MKNPLIQTIALILCFGTLFGQSSPNGQQSPWLKGYKNDVRGEILTYHSPHPEATTSLLVRSLNSKQYIEWELQALPADYESEVATFVWMYGIDVNENSFEYKFFLNGQYLFSFYNPKDTLTRDLRIEGAKNSLINFKPMLVDKYGDFMGYAFFEVPVSLLKQGGPNKVKITGETAGDRAWYMTFRYGLDSKVSASQQPALVRGLNGPEYLLRFDIHHFGTPDTVRLILMGKEYFEPVELGLNMVNATLPADRDTIQTNAKILLDGDVLFDQMVSMEPVKQMDMYLLHHSHNDIGYTHVQEEVEQMQHYYLEMAVALAKDSKDHPEESRFKWNTEVLWAVDSYFRTASAEKKKSLIEAIQQGSIELNGMYANELTGLCRQEELVWLFEAGRRLSKMCGVPLKSAMISDIPGYTWGLVPAMGESGIRYFSVGTNHFHRIGSIMEELADKPFWWESPDGKHRVLTWVHGKGYAWFHTGLGFQKLKNKIKEKPVFEYLNSLEQEGYPFNIIVFRYNIGSDNGPPDPFLADHIKKWNKKFISPRIIISTVSESFEKLEESHGDELPVFRGDLTPYWEDGALSSARETAMVRNAAEKLVQAQILRAIYNPLDQKEKKFREAWENVLLYNEHTWGSWNSISEPEIPFTIQQWETKKSFADSAVMITQSLLYDTLWTGKYSKDLNAFDVINTSSWTRSDVIYLSSAQCKNGQRIKDEDGHYLPTQSLQSGEVAVFIEKISPFSSQRYFIEAGSDLEEKNAIDRSTELADEWFRISLDEVTGEITGLVDRKSGHALIDISEFGGLDALCYVNGRDPANIVENGQVKFKIKDDGELIKSFEIKSGTPGCGIVNREIRLVSPLSRIDIINKIYKENVYDPEGVYFMFPFDVPEAEIKIDVGYGYYIPEKEQIPGSNKNYYTPQRWVDISNESWGLNWISKDAPVIELGEIATDATVYGWKDQQEPTSTIISYVMNNYWETNYKASQDGMAEFSYSIMTHDGFDAARSEREALEVCQPLIVVPSNLKSESRPGLLSLNNNNVIVTLIKRKQDQSGIILRLYNASDRDETVRIKWGSLYPDKVYMSNFYEERLEETGHKFDLKPFETITLLVK